jgi:transcriptional regulator with PAS, ATPase and Fis domain
MSKILLSWSAFNNDFTWVYKGTPKEQKDQVKEDGPTFTVHKYFGSEYDKHVLLNSRKEPAEIAFFNSLAKSIETNFKHKIEPRHLIINDPIDIAEIFTKVSELLSEYKNFEVDIFVNPGTPQMQIAWYLVSPTFKKNVKLFQLRESRFTDAKIMPERIYSAIDTIFNPTVLSVANEATLRNPSENKILITESIRPIYLQAEQIGKTNDSIGCLILGENGTGKENLASYIHKKSNRKDKPFIAINCGAFSSEELLQSELFGHEKGAFTGAIKSKKGIFEVANGGTIFLDEIGDISRKMQIILLRALQEKKIQRVGGTSEIDVDVRIIAATNQDLEKLCEERQFRWDLFFRLAITTLILPPLRDWSRDDIKRLIEHFNGIYFSEFPNRQKPIVFSQDVITYLTNYHFRGNVRELQNLIISLYVFSGDQVTIDDLPIRILNSRSSPVSKIENEKEHIKQVFESKGKNISRTAKALGIARDTLKRKLIKYELK